MEEVENVAAAASAAGVATGSHSHSSRRAQTALAEVASQMAELAGGPTTAGCMLARRPAGPVPPPLRPSTQNSRPALAGAGEGQAAAVAAWACRRRTGQRRDFCSCRGSNLGRG